MNSLFQKFAVNHLTNIIKRYAHKVKTAKKPRNFVIVRARHEDYDKILMLMRRAYYTEEPTTSSLGFQPNALFEDQTVAAMSQGLSLIARCKYNGEIIGGAVNQSSHPWDPDEGDKLACAVQCPKTRQLLHFYAYVQRQPNLWAKYHVQSVYEITYVFVKRTERGKGIAMRLMEASREVGADCGFPLVRTDASSHYTALMAEKLKMKMVYEIPYCSYVGENMKPIFNPPEPHKSLKVYIDDEPQKNCRLYNEEKAKRKK